MKLMNAWLLTAAAAMVVAVSAATVRAEEAATNDNPEPEKEEVEKSSKHEKKQAEGYSRSKTMAKHYAMRMVKKRTHGRYRVLKVEYTHNPKRHRKWTCAITYEHWD